MKLADKQILIKAVSWAALLALLVVIFILSSQPADASNNVSKGFIKIMLNFVNRWLSPDKTLTSAELVKRMNHIVRKFTHGASYFALGLVSVNAFRRTQWAAHRVYVFSLLFCVLFAISDETHQIFVPGRSGEVRDVLIDSTGAILAISLCWGIERIRAKKARSMRE